MRRLYKIAVFHTILFCGIVCQVNAQVESPCEEQAGFHLLDLNGRCSAPKASGRFLHWKTGNHRDGIPYYISSKGSKDLSLADVTKAIKESFEAWKEIEGVALDFKFMGYLDPCIAGRCNSPNQFQLGDMADGKNVVYFDEAGLYFGKDAKEAFGNTRIRSREAATGEVLEADIILNGTFIAPNKKCKFLFNTAIVWNLKDQGCSITSQLNYRAHLQSTLVHEIGHFLGLHHTGTPGATMSTRGFDDNTEQATLEEEDKKGARFLYKKQGELGLLIPFLKGSKYGYSNERKEMLLPAIYEDADVFKEGLALVRLNGKYGFIDRVGKTIVPFKYDSAENFQDGLARVEIGKKWGYVTSNGNELVSPRFDEAGSFREGLAPVCIKTNVRITDDSCEPGATCFYHSCGYLNKAGKLAVSLKYTYAYEFKWGIGRVEMRDRSGFVDKMGSEVVPLKYDRSNTDYTSNLICLTESDKSGCVDATGKVVIPFKFESLTGRLSQGLLTASIGNNKTGYIDSSGRTIIPFIYSGAGDFSEGLADVWRWGDGGSKCGFIDLDGNEVIQLKYDAVGPFSEGLAGVKMGGKWGAIDKRGRLVIPFEFDRNPLFENGTSCLPRNKKHGCIDRTGRTVIPFKYDDIWHIFVDSLMMVEIGGLKYFIDRNGVEYFEP